MFWDAVYGYLILVIILYTESLYGEEKVRVREWESEEGDEVNGTKEREEGGGEGGIREKRKKSGCKSKKEWREKVKLQLQ